MMRRPGDTAARYGGEEFIAVLSETELTGALNVAESIREAVAALAVPHTASPSGHITISIGVACARPTLGDPPSSLIREADQALYDAKRAGRDQVMSGLSSMMSVLSVDTLTFDAPTT
jgi:diguanylate cyclase (GGDEF)-like protein